MIALLLGQLLIMGMGQLLIAQKKGFEFQQEFNHLQDNGRFALDQIVADIRRSNYFSGVIQTHQIFGTEGLTAAAATCALDDNSWGRMLEQSILGLNDSRLNPAGDPYDCVRASDYLRGDILVTRYAAFAEATLFQDEQLYLRSGFFTGRLFRGRDATLTANRITDPGRKTSALVAAAYFVGRSRDVHCRANAMPALFRVSLAPSGLPETEEYASGIEQLQLQYGVDQDGNGSVDRYFNADQVTDWQAVKAVRVWLLTRSRCETGEFLDTNTYRLGDVVYTPNDHYQRQLYTATVMLRNRV